MFFWQLSSLWSATTHSTLPLWPFAVLFRILSSSSTQCSNLCPQWCVLIFNSLQTTHACSDYVNLVYFCLSERPKQPEGTDMVNYEAKSDSQCVRNLPEVLELDISAVRKCYIFVLTYICVWVLSMRVALYSYSASRLLWIILPVLNKRMQVYFLTCDLNYNN